MTTYSLHGLRTALFALIADTFSLDNATLANSGITLQLLEAAQAEHGDLATNAAMVLARHVRKAPRMVAEELCAATESKKSDSSSPLHAIASLEVAGPGFINITLTDAAWASLAAQLATDAQAFIQSEHVTPASSYLLEFVSANPTGPLHLGHGRIGIIGDVLKRVLNFCGHNVHAEFYINDAGVQMGKMGTSLKIRCQQAVGQDVAIPEDGYHGTYLVDIAAHCIEKFGKDVVNNDPSFFSDYAYELILAQQRTDLADFGITFDSWFSEQSLHDSGAITAALDKLQERGFLYENDGALWFKATEFGDDKDRVIRKQDGSLTYIAADIAYHANKFDRGFATLVNVLGQDHHGYIQRLKGTMSALGYEADNIAALLCQLVSIKKGSIPVRMSKRAGTFTSLRDVIDIVGVDAARFFFLHKKMESHLELDIEVALKQSQENPVFYLQYAYVRTNSLLEKAANAGITAPNTADFVSFSFDAAEQSVLRKALGFNQTLSSIEKTHATHLVAQYGLELAQVFHSFYTNNKIILPDDVATSQRRLGLVKVVQQTLDVVHDLLGLTKRERM